MGLFGASSPFDQFVEKATSEVNTEECWANIMEICDKVSTSPTGPKDCLRSIVKRLNNKIPIVQMQALTLLDACVKNCGKNFHREVASKDFTNEARSIIKQSSPKVGEKFREILMRWSQNEFKADQSLSIIPSFYNSLRPEDGDEGSKGLTSLGSSFASAPSPSSVAAKEDEDLQKAIALSLKEAEKQAPKSTTLYPTVSPGQQVPTQKRDMKETRKVRALYDFEAVEDNELTFKTGEIIVVTDDSDANWWKGTTWRGEGLFPASFVTSDLTAEEPQPEIKKVQFSETVSVKQFDPETVQIDEVKIDQALNLIQNADPTGEYEDSPDMLDLEAQCKAMVPLIDQDLQKIDRKYNELAELNRRLTESFQLYSDLMQEPATAMPQSSYGSYVPPALPYGNTANAAAKGYTPAVPSGYVPQQYHLQGQLAGMGATQPGAYTGIPQSSLAAVAATTNSNAQQPYQPLAGGPYRPGAVGTQHQYAPSQPYVQLPQGFAPGSSAIQPQYGGTVSYGAMPASLSTFSQPMAVPQQQLF